MGEEPSLDLTDRIAENLRRAREFGRDRMMLVVSAENCPGCELLENQLQRDSVRKLLAGRTYVVRVEAGDLYDDPPRKVKVGTWTLETPGFPTTWTWDIEPDGLRFRSVALGPLPSPFPEDGVEKLLAGESVIVPEAAGAKLTACSGGFCLVLDRANGFLADFSLPA